MNEIEKAIKRFIGYGCEFDEIVIKALKEKAERDNPKPLTLNELGQIKNEPVWILFKNGEVRCDITGSAHNKIHLQSGIDITSNTLKKLEIYKHKPTGGKTK